MPEIREYLLENGQSPFAIWFDSLEARAAAKVTTAKTKVANGQTGNLEPVGAGVFEYKIDYGPGYRVYMAYDGSRLVILLGGGDKTTQSKDIATAKQLWIEYKRRKSENRKKRKEPEAKENAGTSPKTRNPRK
jgi:putative addiction module killer protein